MNQGTKLVLLKKKNRIQKSRASVPLREPSELLCEVNQAISVGRFRICRQMLREPSELLCEVNQAISVGRFRICRQMLREPSEFLCEVNQAISLGRFRICRQMLKVLSHQIFLFFS
jgi:hypothetical protein